MGSFCDKREEEYSSIQESRFVLDAGTREESVVRVSSCARRVSSSVVLVTGSRMLAQRSSCGGEEVSDGWDERDTPPSSVSGSGSVEADMASAWARDSVCWYSWSVRQRWKRVSASSRRGRGSMASSEELLLEWVESRASTMLVRIWAVLLGLLARDFIECTTFIKFESG